MSDKTTAAAERDRKHGIEQGFPWVEFDIKKDSLPLCGGCKLFGMHPQFPCIMGEESALSCVALNFWGGTRSYFQPKGQVTATTIQQSTITQQATGCPACAVTRDKIRQLRVLVWNEDIPHPSVPEYLEHHESISKILKFIDEELLGEVGEEGEA